MVHEILFNIGHNLFKPLLLFFAMGMLVPLLKIELEFPKPLYQSLTMYLLLAIGWRGGEELALLTAHELHDAVYLIALGGVCNAAVGLVAYQGLRNFCNLGRIDAGTIAGYYGSDSAGTFVTCVGVLTGLHIAFAPYAPVLLAAMEIPGCLIAIFLAGRARRKSLQESASTSIAVPALIPVGQQAALDPRDGTLTAFEAATDALVTAPIEILGTSSYVRRGIGAVDWKLMHEVFLNPSIYLLFGGIVIGFVGRRQGLEVVTADDEVLIKLFQGALCFFLFEMGITAARHVQGIRQAGWRLALFALVAPNVFAAFGITLITLFSRWTGHSYDLGTTVIFGVLCGSASYIAVPAVQRMAIPEANPSLPLIASLGVTFGYNVTVGISVYLSMAKAVRAFLGVV